MKIVEPKQCLTLGKAGVLAIGAQSRLRAPGVGTGSIKPSGALRKRNPSCEEPQPRREWRLGRSPAVRPWAGGRCGLVIPRRDAKVSRGFGQAAPRSLTGRRRRFECQKAGGR
jgi:hypothetical protein